MRLIAGSLIQPPIFGPKEAELANQGDDPELDRIVEWFDGRGFGLRFSVEAGDVVWANLTRRASEDIVAPRYGRGDSSLSAARSARRRYEQEEDGLPFDGTEPY